jgi:hypothetical protein
MKESDNSKIHISSNFILTICLLIMLDTFITRTTNTLQHFAALHHTSSNYTSLHLSTLHFLSFTLHYPLIWLNPLTFPTVLFHLTSLATVPFSHLQTYFQNNEPLHCPKETLTISLHFTFYLFIYLFIFSPILSTFHFTLLC